MKRQIIDLIIIAILITIIYIKDMFLYKSSQINLIQTTLGSDLTRKLEDYSYLLKENNLNRPDEFKCITRIKNRSINDFYKYIMIYNNKNCYLNKNDIVVNAEGLIGFISKTNKISSSVKLLTNSDTNLSIRINNNYGTLFAKNGKLYAKDFVNTSDIEVGSRVYTSGLTNIPKDLLIGTVSKTILKNNVLVYEIIGVFENQNSPYVSIYGEQK